MVSIPASAIVSVVPGVVSAGGNALDTIGLALTSSSDNGWRVPYGAVQKFTTAYSVGQYFGLTSKEYAAAQVYFSGYVNCTKYPGAMLFAQYNGATAVGAWLKSGNVTAVSIGGATGLDGLKTITTGTLSVEVDGYVHAIAALDLHTATSFTAAATLIQAAFDDPTEASFTATISGNVMTVSAVSSGTLSVGQTVTGTSVTAGSIITALGSGTGLTGTYTLSKTSTVSSGESMSALATQPTVTFDSITGSFIIKSGITGTPSTVDYATGSLAATLLLTSATSATLSQGAAATTPGEFMSNITNAVTQDWATFTTLFDPDAGSGNAQKLAFAAWNNAQNNRYMYVCSDSDATATTSSNAISSLGYLIGPEGNNYSGTFLVYQPTEIYLTSFIMGWAASLDWNRYNGRTNLCFRAQSGLPAQVTSALVASNLQANGYNSYNAYSTANETWIFMYPGSVSGPFAWADSYVQEIYLNSQLQLALMNLLTQVGNIPYNAYGYGLIEAAMLDPVLQAVNYGTIRTGIRLSQSQIAYCNSIIGKPIDQVLSQRGYYISVADPGAQARAARQSPIVTLLYTDGQSVQAITVSSLLVM